MSLEFGINLTALKQRAIRTVKVYLVLSVVLGILYWLVNPLNIKDISSYMMGEGISNWADHSMMNMLFIWMSLSMSSSKKR